MARFSIVTDDELAVEFKVQAVRRKLKLNEAFEEAMTLWLKKGKH